VVKLEFKSEDFYCVIEKRDDVANCIPESAQKEAYDLRNEVARLTEALQAIMASVGTSTEAWHIARAALPINGK
jgi:hypothetical protein